MTRFSAYVCVTCSLIPLLVAALPIVDPGVFVIQGIETCGDSHGYCMLGMDCTPDIDFMAAEPGEHCDGLVDAFTPSVQFTCCRFNERGKATSEAPTTEQSSFTITDVEQFLQEEVPILDYQQNNEVPEDVDPESLINIVGVITDMTGVLGLVTEPYKGTIPSHTTAAPLTPTTSTTPTTTPAPKEELKNVSNSSHASISLADLLSKLKITQAPPSTTTTEATPQARTTQATKETRAEGNDEVKSDNNRDQTDTTATISANSGTFPTTVFTVATSTNLESWNAETSTVLGPTASQLNIPTTVLASTSTVSTSPTFSPTSSHFSPDQNTDVAAGNTIVIER